MKEEEIRRIENSFNTSYAPVEASGAWVGGAIHGAKKEFEYWRRKMMSLEGKIKERDDLLEEMANSIETHARWLEAEGEHIYAKELYNLLNRYRNLKAK